MLWVIRWSDTETALDHFIVVEAPSRAAAEAIALKRDIPVAFLGAADASDIAAARKAKLLWQYSSNKNRLRCFGEAVGTGHVACLILCGLWTIGTLLQTFGLLRAMRFHEV